jgi:hypothetical protein
VDIRGARPLHSGCCEAVLECASHAVDSRIFGSSPPFQKINSSFQIKPVLAMVLFISRRDIFSLRQT